MSLTATDVALTSPYKGLAPFEDSDVDALLFFGREWETEVVAANVLASRLTVLYGPSGVGKSSLLRAGVVRALRHSADPSPAVAYFGTWAGSPLVGLEESARAAVAESLGREPAEAPGELTDRLAAWSAELGSELCLLIDQLEELFLYHPAKKGAGGFVDLLPELVLRPGLRVNVLLGVRDDALSQLDVFKERIPGLFMNSLRLDHLDRAAAREAILGPLGRFTAIAGAASAMTIEPALVDDMLDQVSTGKIEPSLAGRGAVEGAARLGRVETPYLQLVLQRLWEVEREHGSSVLRHDTFRSLGGAEQIVEDHLDRALSALTPAEQDAAANVFDHLVTPSGTKIAHGVGDLASYASVGEREIEPVLDSLARQRILRPLGENGHAGGRYEIFHDVLAPAVLAWRTHHEADTALAEERKRRRRLGWLAALALVGLVLMAGLAAYAFLQRSEAQAQTASANKQRALAKIRGDRLAIASGKYLRARNNARRKAIKALHSEQAANEALQAEQEARKEAQAANANAAQQEKRAEIGEANARSASAVAKKQTQVAQAASKTAKKEARNATIARDAAREATKQALARLYISRSVELVGRDPQKSASAAVAASQLAESSSDRLDAENALRAALAAMRVKDILPGAGPGGAQFASLSAGGRNAADGAEVARFSADGRRIVVGVGPSSRAVRVYRARDAKLLRTFTAGAVLQDVALSRDGRFVAAAGNDGRVWIWNVDARNARQLTHGPPVVAVVWSPVADLLVSVGGNVARIWDISTGAQRPLRPQRDTLEAAVFSGDGQRVATYGEGPFVRIFDVTTGIRISTLTYAAAPLRVTSAAFGPQGDVIVTGRGNNARFWDVVTGEPIMTISGQAIGQTGAVSDVAFSENGQRVATGSIDTVARVFIAATGALDDTFYGHTGRGINDIEFSPEKNSNAIVTAGADHTARLSAKGQLSVPLLGHTRAVLGASFSPDGRSVLTSSKDGTARLWDPYGEPIPQPPLATYESRSVTTVAIDPTGNRIAVGREDGGVEVLELNGHVSRTPITSGPPVVSVAWARAQTLLAATADGHVRIWGDAGASPLGDLDHGARIHAAAISRDGKLVATAGDDDKARIWSLPSGTSRVLPHTDKVTAVAFSPSGKLVATASGTLVYTWRTSDARKLKPFVPEGDAGAVTGVTFGPKGGLLATSSDDSYARIWTVRTGQLRNTLVRHGGTVYGVAFSPDGRWLATGGLRKAGVWQVGDSDLDGHFLFFVAPPRPQQGPVRSIAFGPNRTIVMGTGRAPNVPYGAVRPYKCALCGRLPQLVTIAKSKLDRLDAEARR
jgi:WD40 repeat protein